MLISSDFIFSNIGKSSDHPKLCGNCNFPQNFHTRKLVEMLKLRYLTQWSLIVMKQLVSPLIYKLFTTLLRFEIRLPSLLISALIVLVNFLYMLQHYLQVYFILLLWDGISWKFYLQTALLIYFDCGATLSFLFKLYWIVNLSKLAFFN